MSNSIIKVADPVIGEEEITAVLDVLNSGVIAQGPVVAEFEKRFAEYCGTKYAVAVNSGTAAIHSALHAAGIKPGDEQGDAVIKYSSVIGQMNREVKPFETQDPGM